MNASKYRQIIDPGIKDGSDPNPGNKRLLNISWEPNKLATKYLEQAMTRVMADYDCEIRAIDTQSSQDRAMKMARDMMMARPQMQELFSKAGKPVNYESSIPLKSMDVGFAEKMGGYTLEVEAQLQDVIRATDAINAYNIITENLVRDLLTLHVCALDTEVS